MVLMFFTLLFAALDTGLAFAHALEMIPKMSYEPSVYLLLHRTLYWGFGTIGGVVDVAIVPLTIVLAFRLRRDPVASRPALVAALCYLLAFVLWLALVSPANTEMRAWSLNNPPEYWTTIRDRWEYTHLTRFVIQVAGLSALVLAVIPRRSSRDEIERAA
jgi:hypothetical protein